jgi:hypothetical protein
MTGNHLEIPLLGLAMKIAKATEDSRIRATGELGASSPANRGPKEAPPMNTQIQNGVVTDGFDAIAQDPTASPIRGVDTRFKDGGYYNFANKIDVRDRRFAVLDFVAGYLKLQKNCPPEYLMQKAGEPRPPQPHVDQKDWPLNPNGVPEHPFKWTRYLYLLDVTTGEISTFSSNTVGGRIAINELSDQIAFMRRVRPDAIPIVALQSRDMPTSHGGTKPRPHFKILGWKTRGDIGSRNLLAGPEQSDGSFAPPTSAEIFHDEVPVFGD